MLNGLFFPDQAIGFIRETQAAELDGFKCHGRTFQVCFFKPAHGMTPELESQYGANRLSVTRQLRYRSKNSNKLDLVLSINGLPVIMAELKNSMRRDVTGCSSASMVFALNKKSKTTLCLTK